MSACEAEAEERVSEIRAGVVAQPAPPVEWMFDWAYADPPAALAASARARRSAMAESITMAGALNAALRDSLREDPRLLLFGEDVGPHAAASSG